jgi:hypothetical protein
MVLLVLVLFGQFIFSDKMLHSSDQMTGFGSRVFQKTALQHFHQFPLWLNPRLGGMPTIDAMFGDAFYVPSMVCHLLMSVPRAISMKMVLHVLLAGIFFFYMLRRGFRMSPLISGAGAIFYMFNPQFVSHIYPGHDGKMFVIAWLPFIIWQLKLLMDQPKPLTMALFGFGIGMSILTSHIQMTYFVLWGTFLYWLFAAGTTLIIRKEQKTAVRQSLYFWGAIVLGLGMGAMQLFPSFLYIRDAFSVRGADRGFEFASSWSLGWPEVFSLWIPEFVNSLDFYWGQNPFKLNSEYAGMLPLLLAAAAIVIKPKNRWRIFWGVIAVGTVLFSLGAHTPVFHIAYALIPGVKKFRACSMIMFWFSFSTALLSALFLKDLVSGVFQSFSEEKRKQWAKGLLIAMGVCLALTLLFSVQGFVKGLFSGIIAEQGKERVFEANFTRNFLPFLWVWCVLTITVLGLLRGNVTGKLSAPVVIIVILLLGIVDAMRVDAKFIKLVNPAPYFHEEPSLKPLIASMEKEPFRCYALPGALPQDGEGIHHLEGISGFHDNELHWYREFRGDQQDRNYISSLIGMNAQGQPYLKAEMISRGNPFLNIANAKYLLVRNGTTLLTLPNDSAFDRLSYIPSYTVMDSSSVVEALRSESFDYRRTVALTEKPVLPASFSVPDNSLPINNALRTEWLSYTPNYRKATVEMPADGFLQIAEVFYPGWEIRVDGKEARYYRSDLAWMALPLTSGSHMVEMLPHSKYLGTFLPVSFVAIGIILGIIVMTVVAERKRKISAGS